MNKLTNIRYSVEYLAKKYPEKTGAELLEMFKENEAKFRMQFSILNSGKLKTIEDIKTHGGYFRNYVENNGTIQQFYFSVTNPRVEVYQGIICDVEIISFVFVEGNVQIQRSVENGVNFYNLHLEQCERLGKVNYDVVVEQLNAYIEKSEKLVVKNHSK